MCDLGGGGGGRSISFVPCASESPEEKNHLEIRCPKGGGDTPLIEFPVDPGVWRCAELEGGVVSDGEPCRPVAE
jgi:hypothetical protein